MTYYIQLKDGVAFAYVESDSPVENSIILEEGVDPNSVLAKKFENNKWIAPTLIHFIEKISSEGIIEKVNSTVYVSDATGEVVPEYVNTGWKKKDGEWVNFYEIQQQQLLEKEKEVIQSEVNEIINSRPYPSWNYIDGQWVSPVPRPEENSEDYYWDESTISWQLIIDSEESNNEITS